VQLTSMSTVTGAFKGLATGAPCRLDPEPVLTRIVYGPDGMPVRDGSQGASDVIELMYDHLICAVGTASRSSMVRGAKEHCFNLKTSQDSKRLRTAIGEALEYASRPDVQEYYYPDGTMRDRAREERRRRVRVAVVGGGPTGVELCGELRDFFRQVCGSPDGAFPHLLEDVSVTLVHGGPDLLPAMDPELRGRALSALRSQGVEVRLNTRLNEVGRDYIKIIDKGVGVEETIPLAITVWAAGNAPVPFVGELLSQLPKEAAGSGGRINVDRWLRCPTPTPESFGSVLVLGDAACLEKQSKYDTSPEPLPQTAQVAGQQGAFVARMLNRGYDVSRTPPALPETSEDADYSLLRAWLLARGLEEAPGFDFLSLGLLAYVGQEEALNQVMVGDVPLFNYSGKVAFALWRTVYLTKQASTRNQALIAFDWLRTETFGRDITRL
jgi:NADH dehydrogenase FAD-containing subunit